MDTSQEYVNMCKKATEMQKLWDMRPLSCDDVLWNETHGFRNKVLDLNPAPFYQVDSRDEIIIWLPRQDQLQDMVCRDFWGQLQPVNKVTALLQYFYWWLDESPLPEMGSLEQLWLAFAMDKKYHKEWDGNDWIGV